MDDLVVFLCMTSTIDPYTGFRSQSHLQTKVLGEEEATKPRHPRGALSKQEIDNCYKTIFR